MTIDFEAENEWMFSPNRDASLNYHFKLARIKRK
jgi:hypothetical protein